MVSAFRRLAQLDEMVLRILRNVATLFTSTTVIGLVGVVTLTITARALGPAGVGVLALVEAYVRTVNLLARIQPTDAVIKYAAEALETNDRERFSRLVKLSVLIDLVGSVMAGIIAIALAWWIAPLIGLGEDGYDYILLVALSLFVCFRPTGVAILRLFDRFGVLAIADSAVAFMRLGIAAVALAFDLGLWAFVVMLFLHGLADGLVAFLLSLSELRKRGFGGYWRSAASVAAGENPGFFRFLWTSNIHLILRQATQRFDVLALGVLVSPATVGLYQVAKRSAKIVERLANSFTQVLFPELARLWARGERQRFGRMVTRFTLLTFAVCTALFVPLALALPFLVDLLFGEMFQAAAPLILVQSIAIFINVTGLAFNPALLSMGLDRQLMNVTIFASILFAAAFVPAVMIGSAMGAMICHVMFNAVLFLGCVWLLYSHQSGQKVSA